MKAIIAKKIGMTQLFADDGAVIPVTMVQADPVVVTQVKTKERDGYEAVQIGSGSRRKMAKSLLGHLHGKKMRYVREFALSQDLKVGDTWDVSIFTIGDKVKVTGQSKGKGFQGVVKRWGFHGSPASHGHKDQLRMPGSIGATGPARVFPGTRMGGHMGDDKTTIAGVEIMKVDIDNNILYIKGAVPGARNGLVLVYGDGDFSPQQDAKESDDMNQTEAVASQANNDASAEQEKASAAKDAGEIKAETTVEEEPVKAAAAK